MSLREDEEAHSQEEAGVQVGGNAVKRTFRKL